MSITKYTFDQNVKLVNMLDDAGRLNDLTKWTIDGVGNVTHTSVNTSLGITGDRMDYITGAGTIWIGLNKTTNTIIKAGRIIYYGYWCYAHKTPITNTRIRLGFGGNYFDTNSGLTNDTWLFRSQVATMSEDIVNPTMQLKTIGNTSTASAGDYLIVANPIIIDITGITKNGVQITKADMDEFMLSRPNIYINGQMSDLITANVDSLTDTVNSIDFSMNSAVGNDYAQGLNISPAGIKYNMFKYPGVLKNLLGDNGNFEDANSLQSGFVAYYGGQTWSKSTESITDSKSQVLSMISDGKTSLSLYNKPYLTPTTQDVFYACCWVNNKDSVEVNIRHTCSTPGSILYNNFTRLPIGQWTFLSGHGSPTIVGVEHDWHVRVESGGTPTGSVLVDNLVILNLTECFGAGKEPSKEDMDKIMQAHFKTMYIDGTGQPTEFSLPAQIEVANKAEYDALKASGKVIEGAMYFWEGV